MSTSSPTPKRYPMSYIGNRALFKAVMFAWTMLKEGQLYHTAIHTAATYYKVSPGDVAFYIDERLDNEERR